MDAEEQLSALARERLPRKKSRRALLESVRAAGPARALEGPSAARSQDFLYGDDGLPTSLADALAQPDADVDFEPAHLGDGLSKPADLG